jgi:BolA family transcriptional regulator, general stress-responsive regulator
MDRIEQIRARLGVLQPTGVEIADDSARHAGHAGAGGGGHYRLTVISPLFAGKSTLERHRMIYSALHEIMQHGIHALNIRAYAPDEVPPR